MLENTNVNSQEILIWYQQCKGCGKWGDKIFWSYYTSVFSLKTIYKSMQKYLKDRQERIKQC